MTNEFLDKVIVALKRLSEKMEPGKYYIVTSIYANRKTSYDKENIELWISWISDAKLAGSQYEVSRDWAKKYLKSVLEVANEIWEQVKDKK